MTHPDVVVVGAGPVGLLLACLLAQQQIAVAVYERRVGPDERSRAIGIHPPGRAALAAAGVAESFTAEGVELEGGEVLCRGRVLARVGFGSDEGVLVLPQRRTHELLLARLAELPCATLYPGHELQDLRLQPDGVRADFTAGDTDRRGAFAHPHSVQASFLVGADGVRSDVRRRLGIDWLRRAGSGWYAMADVAADRIDPRVRLYCEPEGLVESFPLPGGMRRWVVRGAPAHLEDSAVFFRSIQERTGAPVAAGRAVVPSVFHARQHRASRLVQGRAVLVGDAAHETSPIGGQGMNLGWAAAQRLAAELGAALRRGDADLRGYERHTLLSAGRAQRRSAFYMGMGRPARGAALLGRNTLARALGSAPLRGYTAGLITMRGV